MIRNTAPCVSAARNRRARCATSSLGVASPILISVGTGLDRLTSARAWILGFGVLARRPVSAAPGCSSPALRADEPRIAPPPCPVAECIVPRGSDTNVATFRPEQPGRAERREVVCDLGATRCVGVRSTGELQDLDTNAATCPLESAVWLPHGGIASLEARHAGAPLCHLDYDGGNCIIRAATRRRHAERKLLMVQNPQSTARLEDVGGSDGSRRGWQQDLTRLQNSTTRHRPTPRAARSESATKTG